jgi:hypothetical protein
VRPDIIPESAFPDYELPDHTGKTRRLSELQGNDPLVLTLARGHYCQRSTSSIWNSPSSILKSPWRTLGSPRSPPTITICCRNSAPHSAPSGPSFQIPGELFRRTSISRSTPTQSINPMIPHTLVLKPGLVIYSIYNGYWFWGRPSVIDLWHDLRAVTSEIRPDWDLSTPGLREAWNAAHFSRFHGWNKQASGEAATGD